MKKILLFLSSVALLSGISFADDIANEIMKNCKQIQSNQIKSFQAVANCEHYSAIAFPGNGIQAYVIEGKENGKCKYKKVGVKDGQTSESNYCYAPITVMKKYADKKIKEANLMCDLDLSIKDKILDFTDEINELKSYCR